MWGLAISPELVHCHSSKIYDSFVHYEFSIVVVYVLVILCRGYSVYCMCGTVRCYFCIAAVRRADARPAGLLFCTQSW